MRARPTRRLGRRGHSRSLAVWASTTVLVLASLAAATPRAAADPDDLARWINPMVGTEPGDADMGTGGGAANTFPGADVPFGMVQWSPDTVTGQHGGYYYPDNRIADFSLTHLSGPGCDTYQDIPIMPVPAAVTDSPAADPMRYVATFAHRNEKASAGRYQVTLDNGVGVELATTARTGSGRFTYPAGKPATFLVNTSGSIMGTQDSQIAIGRDSISGYAVSGHFCGSSDVYKVYFYAQFDRPFAAVGTWSGARLQPGVAAVRGADPDSSGSARDVSKPGPGSGGYVVFDTGGGRTVNVKVGLSFVSVAGARGNLAAENGGRDVDSVAAAARAAWNSRLDRIRVAGGTDAQREVFYTALYHALLQPNVFSDSDGRYMGFDGKEHTTDPAHPIYTNFSGWDIYRSEAQLLALIAPHEASDIAQTMVDFAEQGGAWDRWTVANDYTGVMNGDPEHIIVSDIYAMGARDFDAAKALRLMVRGATVPTGGRYEERPGLADYLRLGYVPYAAADTLEYTSADFAIAQLAGRLGNTGVQDTFMQRAQNWHKLLNPVAGYLEPRDSAGNFPLLFDPSSKTGYVEGNGAQYTWLVPYDYRDLIAGLGGDRPVCDRLDAFFTRLNVGPTQPFAFLGNEPTLETPFIYDYAGAPYRTQALVNRVRQEIWRPGPNGLVGNDDLGEMSAWYVWAALGMYPEVPARAELVLGSPEFTGAVITRPGGQVITIHAPAAAVSRPYVSALSVDGRVWTKPWLPESFVADGGTLDYTLSAAPNPGWGAGAGDAPPSFGSGMAG